MFFKKKPEVKHEEPKKLNSDEYIELKAKLASLVADVDALGNRFEILNTSLKSLQIKVSQKRLRDIEDEEIEKANDGRVFLGSGGKR